MSSVGFNQWTVSGNLAADAAVKSVALRDGRQAQVAEATLYVRGIRDRKESFTVRLSIWEDSAAWRALSYLKKGSLILCTGSVEPRPYITKSDGVAKAGLAMTVLDVHLDVVRREDGENSSNVSGQADARVPAGV